MSVPDWLEVIIGLATPFIAGVSALYVCLEYRRSKRWKAGELAMALVGELDRDPTLALACQSLDWGVGPLLIPERYRAFFPPDAAGELPKLMQHDTRIMATALEPSLRQQTLSDPRGLVYRHCFVRLFEHLENIGRLLRNGQLDETDLRSLHYWLENIHAYPYAPHGVAGDKVFLPALKAWQYRQVTPLLDRLRALDKAG